MGLHKSIGSKFSGFFISTIALFDNNVSVTLG